jgi:ribokinase
MTGLTRYESDGSRKYTMYIPVKRRLSLTPEPADIGDQVVETTHGVHLATMHPGHQAAWLDTMRRRIGFISLDTDVSFVRRERQKLIDVLGQVDAFLPSQLEVQAFYPDLPLSTAAERLADSGPRIVVVKCGRAGAHLYRRDTREHTHIPACPTSVVDVTGAGDAFCGGFAAGYLEHQDAHRACWQGAVTAALAIEDYGALHLLDRTRPQALARLQAYLGEKC